MAAAAACTASASAPPACLPAARSSASASSCSTSRLHAPQPAAFCACSAARASASSSAWSFRAASKLRTRIRAAPRFDTSSIFSTVYTLPACSKISCTWSVVSASRPQPKLFSWMRSRSLRSDATFAAAYRRVWYIHWSTRRMGRSSVPRCAMESSVSTARPKLVRSSGMAWLISGSLWYGRPASTMPCVWVFSIHSSVSAPFSRMSALNASSSAHAASTAASTSACVGAATPLPHSSGCAWISSTNRRFFRCSFLS